ncbi:MAG: YbaB/EbfC family nucleoid-associated protein [Spirochaetes bacterium]|nr:YbaB/EbfC family nucleoid-associated protein [Spirochaetota bacterium]
MLKGLGDIGNLMKLQKEFKTIQKKIMGATREGQGANGKVKAVVNGEYKLLTLSIDPEYMKSASPRELEKALLAAVNDAVDEVKGYSAAEMEKLTGGLNIPGLGGLGSLFK